MIKYFKYIIMLLITYNVISISILFISSDKIKLKLWALFPYDFEYIQKYPMNYEGLSLLNVSNIKKIKVALDKNLNKNFLNVNYWNYKLFIENMIKNEDDSFEKSFIRLFLLTKNNNNINLDLKKYFLKNFISFSEENKKLILDNY